MQVNFLPHNFVNKNNGNTLKPQKNTPYFAGFQSKFSKDLDEFVLNENRSKETEISLIETFKKLLPQIKKPENEMGQGFYGVVYKIDDETVVKFHKFADPILDAIKTGFSTKLKTYYGEPIAKIGNLKIMKNAVTSNQTISAGIQDEMMSASDKIIYYREIYLPKFSQLPQQAFDELAMDFKILAKNGKSFDTVNPNNFLADNNTIKVVDDLQEQDGKFLNSLAGMFKVFINSYDKITKADYDVLAVGMRQKLFRKILIAGEKSELSFGTCKQEREELIHAVELCNFQTSWSKIQSDLCDMRRKYPNMTERIQNLNKYLDEL